MSEFFLIGEYLAKLQATAWLSHALWAWPASLAIYILCFAHGQHTAKNEERARDNHVSACNFAKYSPILNFLPLFHFQTQQ